jgi:hypothetical protein
MGEPALPSCPDCGGAEAVLPLRDALTGGRDLSEESRQQALRAAQQYRARPSKPPPAETSGESGDGPPPTSWVLMDLAAGAVGEIWRRTAAKKFRERVVPAVSGRMEAGLQGLVAALDRHPDLWCCQREHVVFLAGGRRTAPMADAVKMLIRNEDATLMALLAGS